MARQVKLADVSCVPRTELDIVSVLSQIYPNESSQWFNDICDIRLVLQMRKLELGEKWLPQGHIASTQVAAPGSKGDLSTCKPEHLLPHSLFPWGVTRAELKG